MSEYAVMPLEDYKNTCDAVREKTGSEEVIKSGELAGEVEKVYEAGIDEGLDMMWETIQVGGLRTDYSFAFRGMWFTPETFKPKYDIVPVGNAERMFNFTYNKAAKVDLTDCGVNVDFSRCTNLYWVFCAGGISKIGILDARNVKTTNETGLYQMFYGGGSFYWYADCCRNALEYIEKFIVSEDTDAFFLTFQGTTDLKHCIFEGVIAKNGLTLSQSNALDYESLISVIDCLKDYSGDASGTVWKVTFGSTNLAKLTTEDKVRMTAKGWTYA